MMTYYVETTKVGVSILSDLVVKPFSVRPAADDDLLWIKFEMLWSLFLLYVQEEVYQNM